MKPRVVVSQLGARMHYAVPRLLHQAGMLERLYTDIRTRPSWSRAMAVIPPRFRPAGLARLLGRRCDPIPERLVTDFPAFGLDYTRRLRSGGPPEAAYLWAEAEFSRRIVAHGFDAATMLYAFSGAALGHLRAARERGLATVVEQVVAPHRLLYRILSEEADRHPEWRGGAPVDPALQARFADLEAAEWDQAGLIVCGSEYVVDGLRACGGPAERAVVVPYGVDHRFRLPPRPPHDGPLRVLVVGEVGLRKGSPYVLEAARRLGGAVHVRMIGPGALPASVRSHLPRHVEVPGPVPRAAVRDHFAWADVFLLPSLCEGSATVTYEALAASLPVVCTHNTGSVVRDGCEGIIVPPRDPDAIAEALMRLAEDRALYAAMVARAAARADHCGLDAYGRRLLAALAPAPAGDARSAAS